MIRMNKDKIKVLAGSREISNLPLRPFFNLALDFLDELSKSIRTDKGATNYPDLATFGFYCRRANIERLKSSYEDCRNRLGRGLIFHIAPSNVPINFAFSFVFGLLSGNANIVRISSKQFPQVYLLCSKMDKLLVKREYEEIRIRTMIVEYERDKEITDYFSSISDGRIIWGGDQTIQEIRHSPLPVRSVEIAFADRYSLGIINPLAILSMTGEEINRLAQGFCNDTYLFDQNACTTPHLILWKKEAGLCDEKLQEAKLRFWETVFIVAAKYDLAEIKVSEKYGQLCEMTVSLENIEEIRRYENLLYVVGLNSLDATQQHCSGRKQTNDITQYRGRFGLFFEAVIEDYAEILPSLTEKVQTIATAGIDAEEIKEWILKHSVRGIDRIVPFGKTLDISLVWDGYDLVRMLSRIVSVS